MKKRKTLIGSFRIQNILDGKTEHVIISEISENHFTIEHGGNTVSGNWVCMEKTLENLVGAPFGDYFIARLDENDFNYEVREYAVHFIYKGRQMRIERNNTKMMVRMIRFIETDLNKESACTV